MTAAAMAAALSISFAVYGQEGQVPVPVRMNEIPKGDVLVAIRGDEVVMRVSDLEGLGISGEMWQRVAKLAALVSPAAPVAGTPALSLRSLEPWVASKFDESNLTLTMTVDPRMLAPTTLRAGGNRPVDLEYSHDTSTFFNYSLTSSGVHSVGFFGEVGTSLKGNLLYSGVSRAANGGFRRGLTNYTVDQRSALRRWVVGDAPVSTDSLGGGALLGGVTVSRNYDLDPYFLRYPTMTLSGTALTPSRVDVYVNGGLVAQREVPPGPFDFRDIPGITGAGVAQLVVRDAFGNERSASTPFYFSTSVLAPGLSEYVYSAGFRREGYGARNFSYGNAALLGYHRVGISDRVTVGGRVEATRGLWSAGPNLSMATRAGDVSVSGGASGGGGHFGTAGEFGYRFITRSMSFGGSLRAFSDEYRNLSTMESTDRPSRESSLFVSFALSHASISAQWSATRSTSDPDPIERAAILTSFAITRTVGGFLSVGSSVVNGERKGEYFAGLSFYLGRAGTANVSVNGGDGERHSTVQVQRPLPVGTGYGYRAQVNSDGQGESGNVALQYQLPFGRYEVGINPFSGGGKPTFFAAGGVVYERGTLIATRPVQESFALVRVPGVSGVRVYASNLLVGRTDRNGDLLVPNLLSYYGNQLRIEDRDVPLQFELQKVQRTVAPPYRGGALVEFPIRSVRTVTGSVVIRKGDAEIIPAFGELLLRQFDKDYTSPIGTHGEFYFENLPEGSFALTIDSDLGSCTMSWKLPESKESMVKTGRITCVAGGK